MACGICCFTLAKALYHGPVNLDAGRSAMKPVNPRRGHLLALPAIAGAIAVLAFGPAEADVTACNRTAPDQVAKQTAPKPEVLHRCPRISPGAPSSDFVVHGYLPIMREESEAMSDVVQESAKSCAGKRAKINHVMLKPKEGNGEMSWFYFAVGECL